MKTTINEIMLTDFGTKSTLFLWNMPVVISNRDARLKITRASNSLAYIFSQHDSGGYSFSKV